MNTLPETPQFRVVSSLLSREICRPIDSLRANLVRLLEDSINPPSEVERTHAATMLSLCDDLKRLTFEYLGDGEAPAEPPAMGRPELGRVAG